MRTTALIRATGLTAALLGSLAVAVPAHAAPTTTVVGNNLAGTPLTSAANLCSGNNRPCTVVPLTLAAGRVAPGGLTAVDGVVVRWRVKAAAAAETSISLRVVRANAVVGRSTAQTVSGPGIHRFDTRISVVAGDRLGIEAAGDNPPIAAPAPLGEATWDRWQDPPLGSTSRTPTSANQPYELLLQADIESDEDLDGFGDVSQDGCVGVSGSQGGCVPPTTTPPPTTPVSPPPPPAGTDAGTPTPPPGPGGGPGPSTPGDPTRPPVNAAPRVTALQFNATRISFRISEPASVSLLIQRLLPGKRAGARCVKPTRRTRAARSCSRRVRAVTGRTAVEPGLNTARLRRLPTGRYRVRLLATDRGGRTGTVIRYFRIRA